MGRVERNFVGPWVRLACFLVDTLSLFSPYPSCLSNEPIPFRPSIRHGDRHAAELLLRHARRRQEGLLFVLRLPRLRHVAALRSLPLRRRRHFNRRGPAPQEAVPAHRRAPGVPLHRQEDEPGEQGVLLQPQDEEAAVREPAVQEAVVGGRQALRQAAPLHQGTQDHREARPRRRRAQGRHRPQQEVRRA